MADTGADVPTFRQNLASNRKHVANVFKEGELPREGFMQILHKTSPDGGRPVTYYNLDVVISVGYRVKSIQGTRFRQWAMRFGCRLAKPQFSPRIALFAILILRKDLV